jgi:rod shape-determining protein MreC
VLSRGPGQSRFTLAFLMVVSISVIALDLLGVGPLGLVRDVTNGLLSPVRAVGDALFGGDDDSEVAQLERRIAELEGTEAEAANYLAELRRLQEELGVVPPTESPTVGANVISQAVGNFDPTIEIDEGANAGIEVNMPVVAENGLVGVVDQVTFTSARIRLITDPEVAVGVVHVQSQDAGVANGQGEGAPLLVSSAFGAGTTVGNGDRFATSGTDGSHFPPNVPVGEAVRVRRASNPLEQEVFIEPYADLENLSQVAVILFTPTQAGGGDDAEEEAG